MTKFIIYKIYWPGRGFYYGKTKGFRKRRNRHLREMADGSHHNKNLVRLYLKFGAPKIKVCVYASSDDDLTLLEKSFLAPHKGNKRCLNIQH